MKITPLDVGNRRFPRNWRGYDPREVDIFLEMVGQEMEELIQENQFLGEETKRKAGELSELKEKEKLLQDAMITAQRMSEDMKAKMIKEAQVVVAQAELEGEHIIYKAQERVIQLQEEIQELKNDRIRFREELRGIINTYQSLLEAGEKQSEQNDGQAVETNVRVMTPKLRKTATE